MKALKWLGTTLLGAGTIAVSVFIVMFIMALVGRYLMDQGEKGLMQMYVMAMLLPYIGATIAGVTLSNVVGQKVVRLIRGGK